MQPTISKLISSLSLSDISSAIEQSVQEGMDLGLKDYDALYRILHRHHSDFDRIDEIPIEKKIQTINKYQRIRLNMRDEKGGIPLAYIPKMYNLIFVRIEFNRFGLQFNLQLLRTISKLKNLEELELVNYPLTHFYDSVSPFASLKRIDFSHNPIEQIPNALLETSTLRKIIIRGTPISKSPERVAALKLQYPHCEIMA